LKALGRNENRKDDMAGPQNPRILPYQSKSSQEITANCSRKFNY